eukprot:TRINITY_DN12992_c0_g1_i3.p1 TRINITY_DN12992_c0_g1~~TRINITY_DN12992_c0_g1_i3.p1  ORF type:complete len:740 (+),score=149.39 TRINITY_DN12992_c0_g1_i3:94-2313(+)
MVADGGAGEQDLHSDEDVFQPFLGPSFQSGTASGQLAAFGSASFGQKGSRAQVEASPAASSPAASSSASRDDSTPQPAAAAAVFCVPKAEQRNSDGAESESEAFSLPFMGPQLTTHGPQGGAAGKATAPSMLPASLSFVGVPAASASAAPAATAPSSASWLASEARAFDLVSVRREVTESACSSSTSSPNSPEKASLPPRLARQETSERELALQRYAAVAKAEAKAATGDRGGGASVKVGEARVLMAAGPISTPYADRQFSDPSDPLPTAESFVAATSSSTKADAKQTLSSSPADAVEGSGASRCVAEEGKRPAVQVPKESGKGAPPRGGLEVKFSQQQPAGPAAGVSSPAAAPLRAPQAPVWPLPIGRERAGKQRLAARDAFNLAELRATSLCGGLTAMDAPKVKELFSEFSSPSVSQKSPAEDAQWVMQLADRDCNGSVDADEFLFALRAWNGCRCLQRDALRFLAETDCKLSSPAVKETVEVMMTELNGKLPVPPEEINLVIKEAAFLGKGKAGRAPFMRAIGAWYAHIRRKDTECTALVSAAATHWLPAREFHAGVISQMATFAPALAADLLASRKSDVRNSEALLRTTLHASANVGNSFANMIQLLATVLILLAHLAALLAPSVFFLSLIYLGGVHGSDKCSKDLDGLLVWYGGVGMASLVLNCMEGGAAGRFVNVAVWSARLMLLVLPWIGAWWSISLIVDEWPGDGFMVSRTTESTDPLASCQITVPNGQDA